MLDDSDDLSAALPIHYSGGWVEALWGFDSQRHGALAIACAIAAAGLLLSAAAGAHAPGHPRHRRSSRPA